MKRAPRRCFGLTLALAVAAGSSVAGQPEQFRVWGSAGPAFPPVPDGWREERGVSRPPASLAATAEERRRGFVLFARDPMMVVAPDAVPFRSERVSQLKTFAAQGEYEPATFSIRALRTLEGIEIQVSALRSAKDDFIPADHVDVRVVRCIRVPAGGGAKTYRLRPFLLEKRKAFAVPRGRSTRVWLTLTVPETAQGGDYAGTISLRAGGRQVAQLKLAVHVYPFRLPPAPIEMAMFYPRPPKDDAMLLRQLIDLREHGCNGFEPPLHAEVASRDRDFGDDDVAAVQAHCRRMMGAATRVFGPRRFPVTFGVGHQIAYYWDKGRNWFAFWPYSKKIEDDFLKALDLVTGLAKTEGWPPLRVYAQDEAGAHNLLDEARHYYRLIKTRRPGLATWTTIGGGMAMGLDEIGRLADVVDVFSTNRFTPEIARALVGRGKPYDIYNGSGPTPAGARFFFGFWGLKTGARQIAQWTYHFGNSVFQGNGVRRGDEGYAYLATDGPLPSPMWEAVREGIDDYRYVHLLRQAVAAAKATRAPASARAEAALASLLGRIGWGFQALHGTDRTPPPHPSTLRKWRRRVASEILKLRPLAAAQPAGPPPFSPFDLAWAAPAKAADRFGAELLPPSGFEKGMVPWQVQAWAGKGKGTLDTRERHKGSNSVRIDIPADSGSNAVTVLVWPSWGKGGLKLRLEAKRVYELSAWAKWQGRATPPALRIALPKGAATTTSGKDEPTPKGWQRLWTRADMSFPATPKYLAAWVQGPGTVWIDDLSLREVIPAPLAVSLDQETYDGLDRVAIVSVAVRQARPAHVRLTLLRRGKQVARLTAPFEARVAVPGAAEGKEGALMLLTPASLDRCQFVLDPSSLAPGAYEAEVELLDALGRAFATQSARFERHEGSDLD